MRPRQQVNIKFTHAKMRQVEIREQSVRSHFLDTGRLLRRLAQDLDWSATYLPSDFSH